MYGWPSRMVCQFCTYSPVTHEPSATGGMLSPLIWKVRYFRSRAKNGIWKVGRMLMYSGSA
jgi:hypothetical protein